MKTQEQIEKALAGYKQMLDTNKKVMDFEETFLTASSFMDDKDTYIQSIMKYHNAQLVVFACEKLIKNCKWILDIE